MIIRRRRRKYWETEEYKIESMPRLAGLGKDELIRSCVCSVCVAFSICPLLVLYSCAFQFLRATLLFDFSLFIWLYAFNSICQDLIRFLISSLIYGSGRISYFEFVCGYIFFVIK